MKEERLMKLLGDVDDQYISEAASEKIRESKKHWLRYLVLAACLCVAGGIGVSRWLKQLGHQDIRERTASMDWVVYKTLQEAVLAADTVLIGTVTDVSVEMMTMGGEPWPYAVYTLETEQVIKGTEAEEVFRVRTVMPAYEAEDVKYVIACGNNENFPEWKVGGSYFIAAYGSGSTDIHELISIEGGWAAYDQENEAVLWNNGEAYPVDEIKRYLEE